MTARERRAPALLLSLALVLTVRASRAQEFDPAAELRKIAKMKNDERLLASFVEANGRSQPNLDEKELWAIADTVEKVGQPGRIIAMLEDRVRRFPSELPARIVLAKTYVRASRTKDAVTVWKGIAENFGLTTSHAVEYARALAYVGDHAGALEVLKEHATRAAPDAIEFWKELAHVAWDEDDTAAALTAYRQLARAEPTVPGASGRLIQLLVTTGALDDALAAARTALAREKDPALLLFIARLQLRRGEHARALQTLDIGATQRAFVGVSLEYWVLRAEVLTTLGDRAGALEAQRRALAVDPAAPGIRAALLWDAIDRGDLLRLRVDLEQSLPAADREHELWAPLAVGLDRLGRTRDAIRFFALRSNEAPDDPVWALEHADALARLGENGIAAGMRRRAFARIRASALAALNAAERRRARREAPAHLDAKLVDTHLTLTQQLRSEPEAARWLRRTLAADPTSIELEELALATSLGSEGGIDRARRHLARMRLGRLERATSRRHALTIAMVDDDRAEIARLLARPEDLSAAERAAAYIRLEQDRSAVEPLLTALGSADLPAGGNATPASPDADSRTLRLELAGIRERTAPWVRGGGTFSNVSDVVASGAAAGASHVLDGSTRLIYGAGGRLLQDLRVDENPLLGQRPVERDRAEGEVAVLARRLEPRRVTEIGLGVDHRTRIDPGVPLPRGSYGEVFQLSRRLSAGFEASIGRPIEDTSFLRIVGARDALTASVSYEPVRRLYTFGSLLLQEDRSRSLKYLGAEVGGTVEGGLKLLEGAPEWTVGARLGAFARDNRSTIPAEYRSIVRAGEDVGSLYPPSYQAALLTTRVSRGDFFERARQDLGSFPRYDCEADLGLIRNATDPIGLAAAVRCAASVRLGGGYVSASGELVRGVAGIPDAQNAHAALSFTQLLR